MTDSKVKKNSGQFTKGRTKTGGRKKGTPNKKSLQILEAIGDFDPIAELKKICARTLDDELKAHICLNLLKYIYPQRKAVEMTQETQEKPVININGVKI